MAELINKTDTLNEGREKLNEAIKDADSAKADAGAAVDTANQALANSESTQTQLDTIVIDGDSSVEAAQARVDEKGVSHPTLKARIDDGFEKTTAQLADTVELIGNRPSGDAGGNSVWFEFRQRGINVKWYGAKHIYESPGFDSTQAFQTAIDAASQLGGGTVYIPTGTYIVEGLVPKPYVSLIGDPKGTILKLPDNPSNHLINFNDDSQLLRFNLYNIYFKGDSSKTKDLVHMERPNATETKRDWYDSIVSDCNFEGGNIGIFAGCPGSVRVINSTFSNNNKGMQWNWEHFYLTNCLFTYNDIGLEFGTGSPIVAIHFHISNCVFGHNESFGIKGNGAEAGILGCSFIGQGIAHIDGNFIMMRINDNRFISTMTEDGLIVKNIGTRDSINNVINNNVFQGCDIAIQFEGRGNIINGNSFRVNNKAIKIIGGNNSIISNNYFMQQKSDTIQIAGNTLSLQINNNNFWNSEQPTTNEVDYIKRLRGVYVGMLSIIGNNFNDQGTAQTRYAVNLTTDTTAIDMLIISNNIARNIATAAYRYLEGANSGGHNIGSVDHTWDEA